MQERKEKRDGIKTCARDFESMEHDVTISNGKQYNNFSYCFYFLLLWLRICIILFLPYTVYLTAARIKRCILRHILTVSQKSCLYRIHNFHFNNEIYSINVQILKNLRRKSRNHGFIEKYNKSRKWESKDRHIFKDPRYAESGNSTEERSIILEFKKNPREFKYQIQGSKDRENFHIKSIYLKIFKHKRYDLYIDY